MNWPAILEIAKALRLRPVLHSMGDDVRVWRADLNHVELTSDSLLSSEEVIRRQRYYFPRDAHRFGQSRTILRLLLGAATGLPPGQVRIEADPLGKPRCTSLPSVEFNVSHSGSVVAYAISNSLPVGVDVELLARWSDSEVLDLAEQCMTRSEIDAIRSSSPVTSREAFFRCWTRKEACLKAVGCGLSLEPSGVEVGVSPAKRRVGLLRWGAVHQVDVESVDVGDGAALSLAAMLTENAVR